ncbi:MAG: RNA polymerase sigma factor [Myxococcaceae bacterium]
MDLDLELAAIAAGDADAFGRWLQHAERPLRESLRTFARKVDTEAALQETLLRVWQVAPKVNRDGRPNALLRMAVRVARNVAISDLRRRREEVPANAEDAPEVPVDPESPDPMLRERIKICVEKLPKQPRLALEARLVSSGRDTDESIAQKLQMRLNTFLQNFGRARKALEECLRRAGVEIL